MSQGRRWEVTDVAGNPVYLTEERWEHICEGHPEILDREDQLRETIRKGRRRQDAIEPDKFRYSLDVPNLPYGFAHIVAIVLFRFDVADEGALSANNFIVTAYGKAMR